MCGKNMITKKPCHRKTASNTLQVFYGITSLFLSGPEDTGIKDGI
jgi:hypothetical protein